MIEQSKKQEILSKLIHIRMAQLVVNDIYKKGSFKVPIHLALGHEAIAVAVDAVMGKDDQLTLSHRNIHYNLAREGSVRAEVDEYLLKAEGMVGGQMGSMNLMNERKGVVYTSSILGNNLAVAAGLAMANCINEVNGAVFVVTGDGAIEEGSFYESLLFEKSNALPVIVIVENNQWSLATKIEERRCPIDIERLTGSLGIPFVRFGSNDVFEYIERLIILRDQSVAQKTPLCIEVPLTTLGWWMQDSPDHPNGKKFINYHAGPSPSAGCQDGPCLADSAEDPIFVAGKYFNAQTVKETAARLLEDIKKELA